MNKECEFIPVFSKNKREWGGPAPDALSWFFSTYRSDFTFRKKVFGEIPNSDDLE